MSDEIRAIQLIQLDLAKRIHDICEHNNLKYIMIGGTLLGAVRHNGFIPWDDDLDIALPRKDYDKLISIIKEEPIGGCFLQNFDTDRHFPQPFSKLRKNGTTFLERYCQNVDMHHGVFIDIFPLDTTNNPTSKWLFVKEGIAKEIVFSIWKCEGCHMERHGWKKIEYAVSRGLSILPKKTLVTIYDSLTNRNIEQDKYYVHHSVGYIKKQAYFSKTDIEERVLLPFEDTQFYAPKTWDLSLKKLFCDYMQYPPEGKRNSGHDVVKVELGNTWH